MLLEFSLNKKKELYEDFLREIGGIKFTFREIDVISCIMHNRGEKKIASLLRISPRTVGTHLHNIMLKLGQNSRESIIDFIEKSGKLPHIKKCYFHILIHSAFEQSLLKIGKTTNRKLLDCSINVSQLNEKEKNKLNNIIGHLKLANINLIKNNKSAEEYKFNIYCITNNFNSQIKSEDILLLLEQSKAQENFSENNYIDFCLDKNYYSAIFVLLEKILGVEEVRETKENFFSEYRVISESWEGRNISKDNNEIHKQDADSKVEQVTKRLYIIPSILLFGVVFYYLFDISKILATNDKSSLRSELFLPQEGVLLSREQIISKIKSAFKNSKGINTIALVGIGGSGKSTIAKKYAKESGATIIWRINAESRVDSFLNETYCLYGGIKRKRKRRSR